MKRDPEQATMPLPGQQIIEAHKAEGAFYAERARIAKDYGHDEMAEKYARKADRSFRHAERMMLAQEMAKQSS